MDKTEIDKLEKIAEEFGNIAKKVNESSKKRMEYAEESINYIDMLYETGETLKN